jgi:hypothetical protein
MALWDEFRGSTDRFKERIRELQELLRAHQIDSIRKLVRAYTRDAAFRGRWDEIWVAAVRDDGGKLTLTTAGGILGAVLGGVGIAALGGAIGLPLLAVLGLGGLVAGTEVDAAVRRWRGEVVAVDIPMQLHKRLVAKAQQLGVEPRMLLAQLLDTSLPADVG